MTKTLLIASVICLEVGAFGMSYDKVNDFEHNRESFCPIKEDILQHKKNPLQNQKEINTNWTNPVEALISMGLLETSSPKKNTVSQLLERRKDQPYRKILPLYPQWKKYINGDLKESVEPSSKITSQIVSKGNSVDKPVQKIMPKYKFSVANEIFNKFLITEIIPLPQLHRACIQSYVGFYKPFVSGQSAEERSIARLKKVHNQLTLFTRKNYMEITKTSSTTASRDFKYGLDRKILKESGVIHGKKIYEFIIKL